MAAPSDAEIWKNVQTYYGQVLKKSTDLQTNACVTAARPTPRHIREALQNVHEEVTSSPGPGPEFFRCSVNNESSSFNKYFKWLIKSLYLSCCPTTVVEVAQKYIDYHMEKYGFQTPNVTFVHGYLEKLGEAGIKNESYDIVISNCVINLVPDKQQVLQEVYRVLKHGGELYFSDVYASLDLPEEIRTHKTLWVVIAVVANLGESNLNVKIKTLPTGPEGDIVEVDEETAAILKNSRFAHGFLISPTGERSPSPGSCAFKSKAVITDPFKLAEESYTTKSPCAPGDAGSCCGTRGC
ncbi:arsenite methyltransferase [Echinops telfairi]|uniref:Arsenite methyltransferase n=1 Tax=Echinops telfairi TaxID=9371 RepID=A0AC55D6K5_ECHTE|nr:arsenite methyltransferase [Echinops telfairi]